MICSAIPSGGTRAEKSDFLLAKLTAGSSAAGGDPRTDGHGCGALNISCVKGQISCDSASAAALRFLREIFKHSKDIWPALLNGLNKLIDKRIILIVGMRG